ncbi:MAG: glycerol dehydrogenase [uncultured bacterium]|nr:MAG: glycerol dehydrogenase [uncultured bacterium]HBH19093.1 glycerol dehydrogenase [Cyanobacteria bacterium UBA9579]
MSKLNQQQISVPSILKIGEGELNYLGKYLKESSLKNVACFFSAGIEEIYGNQIYECFKKSDINVVHQNTIEEIHIENVIHTAFNIPKTVGALIGIGGGKALDYSKYCAHVLALPFISVPTSTSNDGFCSPLSSLLVEGKRKTVNAKIPYGIVVDINAVKESPESCIYSGIGDLISKITAGWDWKEAVNIGKETFNDFAYLISQNTVIDFLNYQNKNIREPKFIYHLANSLLMNGLSMEIAGSSRPASGSEHLISHALDQITTGCKMHGIQVGIATYVCSYIQNNQFELVKDFLINTGFFNYVSKNPVNKNEFIEAVKQAPTVKEDFYTVLSNPANVDKAINFVNTDPLCQKILV